MVRRAHWERSEPLRSGACVGTLRRAWVKMASQPERSQAPQRQRPVLTNFGALPRDALCHISSFLHCHELLDIRCQSKHLRDAIRYAAGTHVGCSRVLLRRPIRYGEMHMEARVHVARAFGHTCRHLRWTSTRFSDKLGQSFPEDEFEDELLVEWCRTAPNLVRLDASDSVLTWREPLPSVARVRCWRMSNLMVGMVSAPPRAGQNASPNCARCT